MFWVNVLCLNIDTRQTGGFAWPFRCDGSLSLCANINEPIFVPGIWGILLGIWDVSPNFRSTNICILDIQIIVSWVCSSSWPENVQSFLRFLQSNPHSLLLHCLMIVEASCVLWDSPGEHRWGGQWLVLSKKGKKKMATSSSYWYI